MNTLSAIKNFWNYRKPISEVYSTKNNAFDILRFIMASSVILFHSYILLGSEKSDFFTTLTRSQLNLGEFAVGSFFIISGFLVTQSLENSKTVLEYFWKRFLRLFPALFISLFISAIVLGPFITEQGITRYFTGNEGTSPHQFIFLNFTLNVFGFSYTIRDLFAHNPYPYAVNGSLWTLKHEFASYFFLAGLAGLGFLKHPKRLIAFTLLIGAAYLANTYANFFPFSKITETWWILHTAEFPYFLKLFWLFLMGAILYLLKDRIFISGRLLLFITAFMLISIKFSFFYYVWYLFAPYLLISLAVLLPLSWFSKYGDFSYGIYIYAFPVQQTLIFLLYPHIGVRRLILFSFVITLIISIFSWYLIEKPSLRLKKKLNRQVKPVLQQQAAE